MVGSSRRVENCCNSNSNSDAINYSDSEEGNPSGEMDESGGDHHDHRRQYDRDGRVNFSNINVGGVGFGHGAHRVGIPEPKSIACKFKAKVKETLFPDDPLRQFKHQPCGQKLWLGFRYLFPILEWASQYTLQQFKSDLVSGLTIASLAIPQGISYAKLASLPPIVGLYSSFVPPLIYAALGSSRDLAVGPVSIASLLMGAMLREEISPVKEPSLYLQLAFTATFFAGVFQASLGVLRLGFIIDFLSRATLVGFMAGAALIVSLQQFKGLLGIEHFTTKMDVVSVLHSVFERTHEWTWQSPLMGISFLVFLLTARYVSQRRSKLFWISAAAPLTSVILATIFAFATRADNHGISIIGHLQKGLNPPSLNMLQFGGPYLTLAIKTGLVTGIISLTEGIAVGRTFASIKDYQVDGNKEMIAIGFMNMAGSCTSCYVTTGSFSRSAVNYNAGCKSAVSNMVMATTVMVTLMLLTPLFYYTPTVVLSSIIIAAVVGLIDIPAACFIWKVDKIDFVACLGAFLGVIFISVQAGLLIAVGISVLKILLHVTRPQTCVLGNIPGTPHYRNIEQYREAATIPAFLILRIDAPIIFANSTYLRERILRWIQEEEDRTEKENANTLQYVILDMTAVTTIDTTGVNILVELKKTLEKRGLQLGLVNLAGGVMEKLARGNLIQSLGQDSMYVSVVDAVSSCSSKFKAQP